MIYYRHLTNAKTSHNRRYSLVYLYCWLISIYPSQTQWTQCSRQTNSNSNNEHALNLFTLMTEDEHNFLANSNIWSYVASDFFLSLLHSSHLLYRLNAISIFCQRLHRLPPISSSKNFDPFVCCFANYFAFYILPQLIWMFLSINANINLHPWSAANQCILTALKIFNQNIFVISNLVIINEYMRWLYGGENDCAMHIEIIV